MTIAMGRDAIALPEGWAWLGSMAIYRLGEQTFAVVQSDNRGGATATISRAAIERGALDGLAQASKMVSEMVWATTATTQRSVK